MAQLIQISFEPAYDAYHSMFRICRLLRAITARPSEYDKFRILDFYLCFPQFIDRIRLKPTHQKYKRLSAIRGESYAGKPDSRLTFIRMQPTQAAAAQTLALKGILDGKQLTLGWIAEAAGIVPSDLASRADELNTREQPLIDFLAVLAGEYDLSGENGLKHRSALMEYRYDAA